MQTKTGMGSALLFDALARGNIECCVDYTGTIWANVMKRTDAAPPDQVLAEVSSYLRKTYGIVCVGPLGFENTYALAMPRMRAGELRINSLEGLVAHAQHLRIGGDYEFFGRPEWAHVRDTYGFSFPEPIALDASLMYQAADSGKVDVITAFSTDGRLAAHDMTVLTDPKHAFPPYQAVLLLSLQAASRPSLRAAAEELVGTLSDTRMREANRQVDVGKASAAAAARSLLVHRAISDATPSATRSPRGPDL